MPNSAGESGQATQGQSAGSVAHSTRTQRSTGPESSDLGGEARDSDGLGFGEATEPLAALGYLGDSGGSAGGGGGVLYIGQSQRGYGGLPAGAAAGEARAWRAGLAPAAPEPNYVGRVGAEPGLSVVDLNRFGNDAHSPPTIFENPFVLAGNDPRSTFSIDVDTASYANARRFLLQDQRPPADAVRIEEFVNYFDYEYPQPSGAEPFSVSSELSQCPWNARHRLLRVGLQGRDVLRNERNASNLVFLIDVSGSMCDALKLPLVVRSLQLLCEQLDARDTVAIVVYAGSSGLVLDATSARNRALVLDALQRLEAGGSTNGGEGIELAYRVAREHFVEGGTNRVILCTDGDFNVGVTSRDALVELIETQRRSGVFLSVLGFGTGDMQDATMEQLADKGNGNYAYIDSLAEARKVLVEQIGGTLETIAKDVKIQIEFNPAQTQAWRLIGYENRVLAHEDFADDAKDAGEIGGGHTVTALYELVPVGVPFEVASSGAVPTDSRPQLERTPDEGQVCLVQLRYKAPDGDSSRLTSHVVRAANDDFAHASLDQRFAAAVAAFGMKLRGSPHVVQLSFADIERLASGALGRDERGYRVEFLDLVRRAGQLR
ncbi:MAG: VWA domain-containing protein [Planctomycetes bacterium]|nr:VWA domain-containing protein [Planctomycetota bacterium]